MHGSTSSALTSSTSTFFQLKSRVLSIWPFSTFINHYSTTNYTSSSGSFVSSVRSHPDQTFDLLKKDLSVIEKKKHFNTQFPPPEWFPLYLPMEDDLKKPPQPSLSIDFRDFHFVKFC